MKTIQTRVQCEGFQGKLYPCNARKDKVLITISGSEGGIHHAAKMAKFHQSYGMPALAVAYFGTRQTSPSLSEIPLEYIKKAIIWLKNQGYERIGIEGISKGAEYAAACAIAFPEISCVILKVPSYFYSEGLTHGAPSNTSCWSYQNLGLPFTPYKLRSFNIKKQLMTEKEYNILPLNIEKDVSEASLIPIEKANGPVLFFSTQSDTVWPSAESAALLDKRLADSDFPYAHKQVCYEKMSHLMFENAKRKIRLFFKSERRYPERCAKERRDMALESIAWLENVWG